MSKFTVQGKISKNISEDSLTEYLMELKQLIQSQRKEIAIALTEELVGTDGEEGYIGSLMGKWNPYLYLTGQNRANWVEESEEGMDSIEAIYSGMDIHKFFGGEPPEGVWWEFATDETDSYPPRKRKLARDYAYYQETGIDIRAKPKFARHKHAIEQGTEYATPHLYAQTEKYVAQLMELKPIHK